MKAIKFFFLVALLLPFFEGCQSDDDPDPGQAALLIGAWQGTKYEATNCNDPDENETTTCTSSCEILIVTATTISFDGDVYSYTAKGKKLTLNLGGTKITTTYSISGTTLTINYQSTEAQGGCTIVSTYEKAISDIDGNIYHSVTIGTQVWMVENLKVTRYRNGDPITHITDASQWQNAVAGAYSDYNNVPEYAEVFGRLYNWYAIDDSRNIAPVGWHVPSDAEWTVLTNYLGGEAVAGGKLKSEGLDWWYSPNAEATNESGFTGLPGGTRYNSGGFENLGTLGYWWCYSGIDADNWDWYRYTAWEDGAVHRYGNLKGNGYSVRCIKN